MQKTITLLISICILINSYANNLNPSERAPLLDHLLEVNAEWSKHSTNHTFQVYRQFESDQHRIQHHLQLVSQQLRENFATGLSPDQMSLRNKVLNHLDQYAKEGIFPQNTFHAIRIPYFKDIYGTSCAVGYLLDQTGNADLTNLIATIDNYLYLPELRTKYPIISKWALEHGFTIEELAWIQPGYFPIAYPWYTFGNGGGVEGQVNIIKARHSEADYIYFAGDFSSIDNFPANSIAAWDGTEWQQLGQGVSGEIHDVNITSNGNVYIVGDFYVNNHPEIKCAAYWEANEWHPIIEGQDIEGTVYTIYIQSTITIGGDFIIETDDQPIKNLAYKEFNDSTWQNLNGAFSVNGIVTDIAHNEELIIAGHFNKTGVDALDTSTVSILEVDGLAYWDWGNNIYPRDWIFGFEQELDSVSTVHFFDGWLLVGSSQYGTDNYLSLPDIMGTYSAGFWEYLFSGAFVYGEKIFYGFVEHDNTLYAYGNLDQDNGLISRGIRPLYGSNPKRALINNTVRAAYSWKGHLYIAGDFTEIYDQAFPGLAYTDFDISSSTSAVNENHDFDIYNAGDEIMITNLDLPTNASIDFYDLSGKHLKTTNLPEYASELSISTSEWSSGIYVYRIHSVNSAQQYTGKIFIR